MLTLYLAPGTSSMAPHIALHEIGAAFDIRPLSFARKDQRDPAYLTINPEGKVPTLLVEGQALTEVAGILYYLARRFPEAGLLPESLEDQAAVVSWMSFLAATVHMARSGGDERVREVLRQAEARLGGRDWAVGETMTIADIHLFRIFWRFRGSFDLGETALQGLESHYARMMARPSVQRTISVEAAIGYELPGTVRAPSTT